MTPRHCEVVAVTGAAGFIGGHLLRHLLDLPEPPGRIVAIDLREGLRDPRVVWVPCDLTDAGAVRTVLAETVPDAIAHLAGASAGDDLEACFAVNVLACRNLLASAARMARPPRVLVVGSAAEYGITAGGEEVVDESRPLLATTPYGVTKTLQEAWALLYARRGTVPVVAVRPFNIMGPGQPASLVPAAFLRQVADVLDGKAGEIRVGNTDTRRDFIDVRDVAAAMAALLSAGEGVVGRVFNVASGATVRIGNMLEACIGLSGRRIPVRRDPARVRAADVPMIVGDASALRAAVGWRPGIPWPESLQSMWQAMRKTP
ncbi:MAG: NAD-dependent epimerase/dehydratase family protein [Phycisphaerae bacterium]